MANPSTFNIPVGAWLKIATAVQYGVIKVLDFDAGYHFTYRVTGDASPVSSDIDNVQRCEEARAYIYADEDIDVYVFCPDQAGIIEVSV